jgi:ABC-type transport system substrate-binding protein
MNSKRHWTWVVSVAALAAGVSLLVVASGVSANRSNAAPEHSHAVGTLKAVIDTVDFLDPQQAYTGQAWWAMWNVYETLVTYKHVDGGAGYKLVPGLAVKMPTVSANGKVYKVKLR